MNKDLCALLQSNPLTASIKDDAGLNKVLTSDCKIVFLLYGTILNVGEIVHKLKASGKIAFIDVDLIEGFSNKEIVVNYLKKHTEAAGILSSKANMIKAANEQGFFTVHRLFIIDSFSFHNIEKQVKSSKPDCIQILPGAMPKVIKWISEIVDLPIIAGGLVCEKEDAIAALKAGATAISSTNPVMWFIDLKK